MARHIEQKHKAIYEELCLFTENCTTSPKSVQNYTDFKRINECINEVLGKEDVSILDFSDPIEFTNLIKRLNSNEKYKSYNKKGNNQYSSAVLNYQNFLFARHYAELVKTNSDTVNLQTIVNEKLKDLYDQETLIEILRTYRAIYANDNVKNNACDVAFGIKYGKFLEKTDIKTISQKASNPDDSNNIQNGYFVNIGVSTYQAICQEKYGLSFTKHQITNSFSGIIDHPLQQIFYGAPGTGKSHKVNETTEQQPKENVFRTTFHPDSDYSTFVGCYKPTMTEKPVRNVAGDVVKKSDKDVVKKVITYAFTPQSFTRAYVRAWQTIEPVFLVIEEINRGNCAQIFGDLFQLLDRKDGVSEYPVDADTDLANFIRTELADSSRTDIPAEVKDGQKLLLPANLYIWATMNTSDQSLFPIDSAFKRRWEWKYVPIDTKKEEWHILVNKHKYSWTSFLDIINDEVLTDETAEDKRLGFYFCKAENNTISAKKFVGKVLFYLWNDVFKVYGVPPQITNGSKEMTYPKFYNPDGSINEDRIEKLLDNLKVENDKKKEDEASAETESNA